MGSCAGLQVVEGITERLGSNIWSNTFVALTHAKGSSLPDGLTYGEPSIVTLWTVLETLQSIEHAEPGPAQACCALPHSERFLH